MLGHEVRKLDLITILAASILTSFVLARPIAKIGHYLLVLADIFSPTWNTMTRIVRLKLPSNLLAHIKILELRHHLQNELSKLGHKLSHSDLDKLLGRLLRPDGGDFIDLAADDLSFILNSPLFLYTIAPRLRAAAQNLYYVNSGSVQNNLAALTVEARTLAVTTGRTHNSCFIQLCYGHVALIDVCKQDCVQLPKPELETEIEQIFCWFCEEVEFLVCEFSAREQAAAEILGCEVARSVNSKIVKLKLGKKGLSAKTKARNNETKQEKKKLKLTLKLWKDAVEG